MKKQQKESGLEEWLDSIDVDEMRDPAELRRIGAALTAVEAANSELVEAVRAARDAGESWSHIGLILKTSKQGAAQRFGRLIARQLQSQDSRPTKGPRAG
jgi:hypothetical protein